MVAQNNIGLKQSAVLSFQVSKLNSKNELKKTERYLKILSKNMQQNYIFLSIFYLTVNVYRFFRFLGMRVSVMSIGARLSGFPLVLPRKSEIRSD